MTTWIYRWLGPACGGAGALTGSIVAERVLQAGGWSELAVIAGFAGVLAAIGTRIGQVLEHRNARG